LLVAGATIVAIPSLWRQILATHLIAIERHGHPVAVRCMG
jgi:hypothetical protein